MKMAQLKRVIGLNMAIFLIFSSFSSAFQLELMHEDLEEEMPYIQKYPSYNFTIKSDWETIIYIGINSFEEAWKANNSLNIKKIRLYNGWLVENKGYCGYYYHGGIIDIDMTCVGSEGKDVWKLWEILNHELSHDLFFNNPIFCNYNVDCEHGFIERLSMEKYYSSGKFIN